MHQRVFARYWRRSLAEEASRVLILARAHWLRARRTRAESGRGRRFLRAVGLRE
ncbi:hypothetical protein SAMN06264365_10452 [Actinoplanes regularis]|uniref:Uncharacterized protein n=1 Tax=Actinoplanes regularis TaxID=52697 RepID=A0A238XY99_9ACTN|nr:hypothetical protein Are01nite_42540 [Actinoplanes regularis]SNR62969.1 hypothetical protein SAMN06264365_10452 [Actinoplanes regularis]